MANYYKTTEKEYTMNALPINNCETMLQVFRDKVIEGETMFISQVRFFKPNNKNSKDH